MKQADEIKRHFDVVAERLMAEIAQVAEGVINLGEKLDREIKDSREENSSAHKDTLAAIKFSYAEIDCPLAFLEEKYKHLDERLRQVEVS